LLVILVVPPILPATTLSHAQPPPESAFYGEWEMVYMVYRSTVQDFQGQPGSFLFEPGTFVYCLDKKMRDKVMADVRYKRAFAERWVVTQRHLELTRKPPWAKQEITTKALYELKNGMLRVLWPAEIDGRPATFDDAATNPHLTYFILKKRSNLN
jgi:hypothetical protein